MMMKSEPRLDLAERRERELNRITAQDLALEKEMDDLLIGLEDDDTSAETARDALKAAASSAKAGESHVPAMEPPVSPDDPAKRLVEDYCFPDTTLTQVDFAPLSGTDQVRALKSLMGNGRGAITPYHLIREQYCAISLAMNERGEVPPKFRCQRPLPPRTQKATADDTLMMRDRQIIDMHWLHAQGKRDELPDRAFANLFVDEELDIDMAAILAEKPWTNETKAGTVLNLIPHEQLQLACLRTKAVAEAWRNAENSMKTTIDRRLRAQLVSEPSLKPHIEDLKLLWLADKMLGGEGLAVVARMHGWLSGKAPLSISTLSTKLKRMRRRTAPKASKA